jgi:hypothetical protein
MPRSPLTILSICALSLVAGCAGQAAARPEISEHPGDPPAGLPAWLRPLVRTQMVRQREYLSELRWTAASLEFDRTSALARRIVQEVQCGRPGEANASLDGLLPAPYLDLQEKLRERAYRLSVVAARGNSHQVTDAYQSMVEVCARCHAVYRPGPPVELPLISERLPD